METLPLVFEDETTLYYEGEIEGVTMRYAQDKFSDPLPKNLPALLAKKIKEQREQNDKLND